MPLLSFSCKEAELDSHLKTDTTRFFTPHRWKELVKAQREGGTLYCWWKSRTIYKRHLYDSPVIKLNAVMFREGLIEGSLWPWWCCVEGSEDDPKVFPLRRMSVQEVEEYVKSEGMGSLSEFLIILQGKHKRTAIFGVPMIRIRFWGNPY
jgi:hypothetical protein